MRLITFVISSNAFGQASISNAPCPVYEGYRIAADGRCTVDRVFEERAVDCAFKERAAASLAANRRREPRHAQA
jgi:hypothetical protein